MTVWASSWGQWRHLFSAVASSESLSLLLCYDIGSDNTTTASVKNIMLALFHKPLPNFNQSQWYHSMSAIFSGLFDQANSRSNYFKEQSQWRRRVGHFVCVKTWWSLNPSHTSKWQAWHLAKGLELRMTLFAPAFTLQHAPSYDSVYVLCVRRQNTCLAKNHQDFLAEFCNRSTITNPVLNGSASVLFKSRSALQRQCSKWALDPWQQQEGSPITLTNTAAGSTDEIKSQRDNHYFTF